MPGLLFPAYQKLYSALSHLERFDKESNFFDNISAIDNFFNEYRNITFVMQESLRHTEHFGAYEKNRDQFLTDHWFVKKRNETIKQKPFELIKEVVITLYLACVMRNGLREQHGVSATNLFPIRCAFEKKLNGASN